MKYKLIAASIALSLTVYSADVFAQSVWGKLKNRVKNQVEDVVTGKVARKAGDKAGEATDAVLNPELESAEEEKQEASTDQQSSAEAKGVRATGSALGGLGGMMNALKQDVTIKEQYEFDLSIVAEQTYNGETFTSKQGFSESSFMMDSDDDNQVLMDLENQAIIMIDKKAKTKIGMSTQLIKQMSKMGGQKMRQGQAKSIGVGSIESTGVSKQILGYTAEQWVFDNGKEKGEVWITREIDFDFISFSKKLMKTFGNEQNQMMFDFSLLEGDYPRGLALESKTSIGGQNESHYLVKDISRKPNVLNMEMYKTKSLMEGF